MKQASPFKFLKMNLFLVGYLLCLYTIKSGWLMQRAPTKSLNKSSYCISISLVIFIIISHKLLASLNYSAYSDSYCSPMMNKSNSSLLYSYLLNNLPNSFDLIAISYSSLKSWYCSVDYTSDFANEFIMTDYLAIDFLAAASILA